MPDATIVLQLTEATASAVAAPTCLSPAVSGRPLAVGERLRVRKDTVLELYSHIHVGIDLPAALTHRRV
jgi:hypothetical protein